MWGVTCPPSSPAQGSSSKAWHRLSFLQNSHNNNINNRLDVVGLGHCPAVLVAPVAAYEGQGRVLAPTWALCCRSSGCGGGPPGWAECSTRFLRQPVTPEENLPPVSMATWGAPPVGRGEDRTCQLQGPRRRGRHVLEVCRGPMPVPRPKPRTHRCRCWPWC